MYHTRRSLSTSLRHNGVGTVSARRMALFQSPHETSWECADRGLRPPWLLGSEDRRIPLWVGTWVGSSVSRVWAYGSPGHNARYWESRRGSLDLTPPRTTSLCREYRGQTRGSGSECGSPNATGRHQSAASFYKVVAATESW